MSNHAFTNYTGRPYIYYNGQQIPSNNKIVVNQQPYIPLSNSESINNFLNATKNRNIINQSPQVRQTNNQAPAPSTAPLCACQALAAPSQNQNNNESWSIMARKDNMFRVYMNNSDKQAASLYM